VINDFIIKAKQVHGDKYDYSKINYINMMTKVIIICPIHGEFEQKPCKHAYYKRGCPECSLSKKSNTEKFITKAKKIHGDKYDYSKTNYINATTKITIICPIHGEFEQTPQGHLKGYGCCKCSDHYKLGDKFTELANKIHHNKYKYSSEYKNNKTKVKIICPVHGEFEQLPANHLYNKNGCPKCISIISSGHQEIINFIDNRFKIIINNKDTIKPYELDIFMPDINIAIEYNGIYFHSYSSLETARDKNIHKIKYKLCEKVGIRLIQIFENEWITKKEIVKSILNQKLNLCINIIYARECHITDLTSGKFNDFCYCNHIQGILNTKYRYGLIYNNELVQIIGFNNHNKYDYICTRLCSKVNTMVIGGASKLLNYFVKIMKPCSILTYADARFSNGNVYNKLGFNFINHTKPNYFYIKNHNVYSRLQFQKHKLSKKLNNFNSDLSEAENMFNNKYRRMWDAGHLKFVKLFH